MTEVKDLWTSSTEEEPKSMDNASGDEPKVAEEGDASEKQQSKVDDEPAPATDSGDSPAE